MADDIISILMPFLITFVPSVTGDAIEVGETADSGDDD